MRKIKLFLFIICLICGVSGGLSISISSELSIADQIRESVNVFHHLPNDYPLLPKPKDETVLVASPDGIIHLMEINTRKSLWSFTSGPSIYSSYKALPSLEDDEYSDSWLSESFSIDIGEDWELYRHGKDLKKKTKFSAEEFIRRTPYISADGGVMTGSKKTTVFLVDAKTGKVIYTFRSADIPSAGDHSENPILPKKDFEDLFGFNTGNLEAVEQPLYIMRTDYALKYTSLKTDKAIWSLMFADIKASFRCQGTDDFFGELSFNEDGFGSESVDDAEFPVRCQTAPVVYRIRDRSLFESIFMPDEIPDSLFEGGVLSLPPRQAIPLLGSIDRLPVAHHDKKRETVLALPVAHHDKKQKTVLALPPPETDPSGIWDLDKGYDTQISISKSVWWFIFLFVLFLSVFAFISWPSYIPVGKLSKLNKQAKDLKVPDVIPKRKRASKSGINKKSTAIEKKQEDFVNENTVGGTNEPRHDEITERKFDHVDGGITDGRKVGKIFVSNIEIAKGSNGTVILEGIHDGRPVAVKRLVQTHHDVAVREIQNLIASDHHPNIIRWYGVEYDQDFVYLSLERCTCSLHEWILSQSNSFAPNSLTDCTVRLQLIAENNMDFEMWKANGYPSAQLLKLMRDIVFGLAHLHELGIIHRDLKPQNVLILTDRSVRAKISDMGISKHLVGDATSVTRHSTGYGTSGWQAPEQLRHERQTRAVDLFSLGCVLFFCITGGKHPFGDNLERDVNIVNNRKDLFLIENIPEALDLMSSLLHPNPELRPTAVDVLHHPFNWDPETRLSFLRDASDRVELEDRENESELLDALESIGTLALGGSRWNEKIESEVLNDIGRYRRYRFDSIRDLLRVIRNKLNHYRELSIEIQSILGQVPEGFDYYFSTRFPKLLIEVYKVFLYYCGEEEFFSKYFSGIQI